MSLYIRVKSTFSQYGNTICAAENTIQDLFSVLHEESQTDIDWVMHNEMW